VRTKRDGKNAVQAKGILERRKRRYFQKHRGNGIEGRFFLLLVVGKRPGGDRLEKGKKVKGRGRGVEKLI